MYNTKKKMPFLFTKYTDFLHSGSSLVFFFLFLYWKGEQDNGFKTVLLADKKKKKFL